MEEIFKNNRKHQLKSISNGAGFFLTLPAVPIYLYITGNFNLLLEPPFYIIWFAFLVVPFLPALYFHTTYYLANKDITVAVDKGRQTITIRNRTLVKVLHASDIKKVIRVINPDFKHAKWKQNWQPLPWRNYGYLKLITHSQEVYMLTSLMLDPVSPPIAATETEYKFFPDLNDTIYEEPTDEEVELEKRKIIENFKLKFGDCSQQELLEKILSNVLRKDAVAAAEELLKERYGYQQDPSSGQTSLAESNYSNRNCPSGPSQAADAALSR